jgi:hypothetical protein
MLAAPVTANESLLARQIDSLMSILSDEDATPSERLGAASNSLESLAHYARNPHIYGFADLARYQEVLTSLLASPASAQQGAELLGQIGTAAAQTSLVNTASNSQLPVELRMAATRAFADAVYGHGLMLDGEAIRLQYLRYNTSRGESQESRDILAMLLDIIERHADDEPDNGALE